MQGITESTVRQRRVESVWMGDRSDAHFVLPQLVCLDQQIQDANELSHAGDDGYLRLFAF